MAPALTDSPTWQAVALAMVNAAQLVALGYLGLQQARSTRERIRRTALDEQRRHQD